ncbi:hypothetical protein [Reichenbachiella ulvae]|uniref:Chaperone of endosialidase n=1 Tax=Reichenbachiella ulvae TaxID=2980104 RepID=A0ABT3CUW6_9BACT|nr:hypothetical protein [Reichenbachiella ulvae]MCV9387468.1 hypothetical protein [Reichenbachiella ulvae]
MTKKILFVILVASVPLFSNGQTHSSTVSIERVSETMIKLQDSDGNYTGYWTMNDGLGNMAIKLGNDHDGKYTFSGDGAAEILWGAHNQDGYISLNAANTGTLGSNVIYNVGLLLESSTRSLNIGSPGNSTGLTKGNGFKIADYNGVLYTHQLAARSGALDINMGDKDGNLTLYDANGTAHVFGDDESGETNGIVLRTTTNPADGEAIFTVESEGFSERLRVEHYGALLTTNYLHVKNDANKRNTINGNTYFEDKVSIGTANYVGSHKLLVDGSAAFEEVKVEVSGNWPDYVFADDYQLTTLEETAAYIEENHHLPEIPSAAEMEANGVELGEMNMLLLKKIEELTLHVIEQQKQIEELRLYINDKKENDEK